MKTYKTVILGATLLLSQLNMNGQVVPPKGNPLPPPRALIVASRYAASGGMGDSTNGTKYVQLNLASRENLRPSRTGCIKISYTEGPVRWAGTYWLNKPNNWGDRPGDDLSKANYSKITFWARGETGKERVEFKAGGIEDAQKVNKDSFEITKGTVELTKDWVRYEIPLQGENLSSVIGVFCWTANFDNNSSGITFYLDDIRYE